MPFNFIAHQSCRHCSRHLFHSDRKREEEEERDEGEVKGTNLQRVRAESRPVRRACGEGCSGTTVGAQSGQEHSGADQNER